MRSCLLMLVCMVVLCAPGSVSARASILQSAGFEQHLGARLPLAATVTDEDGRASTLSALIGPRPAVLLLAYYTCRNLCQTMLGELANRLRDIDLHSPRDFRVLVLSFDASDTPLGARALKSRYLPASHSWHFLTASPEVIRDVTAAVGFRYAQDRDQFVHPSAAVLVTPNGRISSYVLPVEPDASTLRYGLIAASGDRLGSPLDRLWLLCHRYDPENGRYTSIVLDLARATGALSALGLLFGIAWIVRRPRR